MATERERQRFNKQTDRDPLPGQSNQPLIGKILVETLTRSAAKWHSKGAHMDHQFERHTNSSNSMVLLQRREWITALVMRIVYPDLTPVYGLPIRLDECFTANCNSSDMLTGWQKKYIHAASGHCAVLMEMRWWDQWVSLFRNRHSNIIAWKLQMLLCVVFYFQQLCWHVIWQGEKKGHQKHRKMPPKNRNTIRL